MANSQTEISDAQTGMSIFVWRAPLGRISPFEAIDQVPSGIMDYAHGLKIYDTDITPFEAPPGVKLYRPGSVEGRGELFFDVRCSTDCKPSDFKDIVNVGGTVLVSAAMRDALLAVDPDGGHSFVPSLMIGADGKPVTDKEYFHFWCGRRLRIRTPGPANYTFKSNIGPGSVEKTLLRNHAEATFVARLPIWVDGGDLGIIYFDAATYAFLAAHDLSGLDPFSEPRGRYSKEPDGAAIEQLESVARIDVPPEPDVQS